jgi:hypothetical protein
MTSTKISSFFIVVLHFIVRRKNNAKSIVATIQDFRSLFNI